MVYGMREVLEGRQRRGSGWQRRASSLQVWRHLEEPRSCNDGAERQATQERQVAVTIGGSGG
eukprot:354704-Chlamydomonas_euryale.AAC.6